jgi:hypothetical protein
MKERCLEWRIIKKHLASIIYAKVNVKRVETLNKTEFAKLVKNIVQGKGINP